MKSFKQYLAEAELLSQVVEDSNMPVANDSASPISGKKVNKKPEPVKIKTDENEGSNISKTANEKVQLMKEHNIRPGTPEWFQLWFSLPYLTSEAPIGK